MRVVIAQRTRMYGRALQHYSHCCSVKAVNCTAQHNTNNARSFDKPAAAGNSYNLCHSMIITCHLPLPALQSLVLLAASFFCQLYESVLL